MTRRQSGNQCFDGADDSPDVRNDVVQVSQADTAESKSYPNCAMYVELHPSIRRTDPKFRENCFAYGQIEAVQDTELIYLGFVQEAPTDRIGGLYSDDSGWMYISVLVSIVEPRDQLKWVPTESVLVSMPEGLELGDLSNNPRRGTSKVAPLAVREPLVVFGFAREYRKLQLVSDWRRDAVGENGLPDGVVEAASKIMNAVPEQESPPSRRGREIGIEARSVPSGDIVMNVNRGGYFELSRSGSDLGVKRITVFLRASELFPNGGEVHDLPSGS